MGAAEDTRTITAAACWLRVQRWWRTYHWWVVGAAALLATALGFVGFRAYLEGGPYTSSDFLHLSVQLFVLESGGVPGPVPASLEIARWLAPGVAAYAVVGLVASIFRDELTGLRIRLRRGHAIVCGLEAGWALTRMLQSRHERVVVIERDPAHPRIETCRSQRIPVLVGDARDEQVLRTAGIRRAGQLFAVCGEDRVNMRVAEEGRRLAAGRERVRLRPARDPLRVLVHIADPDLVNLLTMQELGRHDPGGARLDFFSFYAGGARALLSQHPLARGAEAQRHLPHMVVVGLGRLGGQLVLQAARNWRADGGMDRERRLRVTLVDANATDSTIALRERHPFLDESCELRPVDLNPDPLRLLHAPLFDAPGSPPVSSVFVSLADDVKALSVGLALHARMKHAGVPVVVRLYNADLAALVPDAEQPEGGLHVVDQIDWTCRPDQLFAGETERLAQALHEVYRRQEAATGGTEATNPSMVPWDRLPEALRDSNRAQAQHLALRVRDVGCDIGPLVDPAAELFTFTSDEIERLARMEHERWTRHAPRDHPANVPWRALGEPSRDIDRGFIRAMPALLASAGYQINRVPGPAIQGTQHGAGPPSATTGAAALSDGEAVQGR
jgi:hypothetical protein